MHLYMWKPKFWYPNEDTWSGKCGGMVNCCKACGCWTAPPGGGIQFWWTGIATELLSTVVMSWMLDLFLSFFTEFWRRKYFWAWLATWVGVLVTTTFLEMLLQSPFPNLRSPIKNNLLHYQIKNQQPENYIQTNTNTI